ncbi:hypothetical protein VCRA2123E76_40056 [Vibrio crassostreae]|nr:hypothetical protein VCRA2123E76_40056 [Vibrio crassostreae]
MQHNLDNKHQIDSFKLYKVYALITELDSQYNKRLMNIKNITITSVAIY